MTSGRCGWVRDRLSDPGAKYLLEHEKEEVHLHLESCGECRAFEEVVSRMTAVALRLEPAPASALEDRRIIHAAMEGRLPGRSLKREFSIRWVVAAAAALLVGAALFAMWPSDSQMARPRPVPAVAAERDGRDDASTPTVKSASIPEVSTAAEIVFDEKGVPLTLPAGDRIVGIPGTRMHIDVLTPSRVVLRLLHGKIVARVDGTDRSRTFTVMGRHLTAEVHGTVFSVESTPDTPDRVRVLEGVVKVVDRDLNPAGWMLHDRQEFTFAASSPVMAQKADLRTDARLAGLLPAMTPGEQVQPRFPEAAEAADGSVSPADRMARAARELRGQKRYGEAKAAYEALIAQFGSTTAGRNALVALAQLEFSTLRDPTAAERHFNAYLQADPDGWLADEAWIGLVRIYAENGQHGRVEETTRTYLRRQKEGTFAPEMIRRRGDALSAAGNCAAAVEYYRTVIDRWTLSREAGAAANGLAACGARVD